MGALKFKSKLKGDGKPACYIEIPKRIMSAFDGRVKIKLIAKLNGYSYQTTVFSMGGCVGIPVRREIREKAKLEFGKTIDVVLVEDLKKRSVVAPADFAKLLRISGLTTVFKNLSYTRQKEHVLKITSAKKVETKKRRMEKIISLLSKSI